MHPIHHARTQPAKAAYIMAATGETVTYGQLHERANQGAHLFRSLGLKRGDSVAVFMENSPRYFEVLFATERSGLYITCISSKLTAGEIEYIVRDSGSKVFIASSGVAAVATEAAALFPDLPLYMCDGAVEPFASFEDARAPFPTTMIDDPSPGMTMLYSSGTTGRPKGVANSAFAAGVPPEVYELMAAGMVNIGFPPKGRTLLCGPGYHSAQWAFSFFPLIGGSSVVMQKRFVPEEMLELIDRHAITNVHLVPTQFVRALRVDEERKSAFDGSSLSFVLHGAAPCSPDVKRQMIEWWGPKITEYYGATEGGVVSMISAAEWLTRPGSVGKPMSNMTVRIVAEEGDDASTGGAGVIHVRNAMGTDFVYLGEPEKTAEAHSVAGFFTLGDIGYLDDEGYLFLSDRKIDMIISGGVNIYPAEIEGVLSGHPLVVDAAVFGVPNEEFGEEVKAALQLVPGTTWSDELAADVTSYVRERLAGYKVPRSWDIVEELPRSEAGKLLKRQIRAPYWEGAGRSI